MGTTIAKQLVELMGGRIGVESAVGLGSTFWFELAAREAAERARRRARGAAGARVLIVGFPRRRARSARGGARRLGRRLGAAPATSRRRSRGWSPRSASRSPTTARSSTPTGEDLKLAQRFRRAAPNPAPPLVLAVPRDADVRRFEVLSSGFAAVLELPFDKRRLFNVLHSVAAGDEVREGVVRLQDYARRASTVTGLRILVADDNPTNREVIGRILERAGHAVTLVNDGEQALDAVEAGAPDLVILDRNMPGMGGMEALQALRLMTRGRARLPIIMLSADVTPEVKREALEAGADAFLAKPIETVRLLDEIQRLAGQKTEPARKVEPQLLHPRPAAPASPAVVNADTLQHLEELGASLAFVEKLVGMFLADGASTLVHMEKVLAAREYHEFRSLLHAMKGSSASIGTDRLTSLCERLGKLSDGALRLQASALHRKLADEMGEARRQLEHHIHNRRKSVG